MEVYGHECTHVRVEVIARANGMSVCLCMRVGVNLTVHMCKSESNGVKISANMKSGWE